MLFLFVPILAALGAAFVLRGREVRGLLVIAVAVATDMAVAIAYQRWPWVAFCGALLIISAIGIVAAKRPEPPTKGDT